VTAQSTPTGGSPGPSAPDDIWPLPWDLDRIDAGELRATYLDLARFVGWLRDCGLDVPTCWYIDGGLTRRLAALRFWWDAVHTAEAPAKFAFEWWGMLDTLRPEFGRLAHSGGRRPNPDRPYELLEPPSFEDFVAAAVLDRRENGRGLMPW
jgi:hypothetical protein